jgi:hypothetical protein
MMTHAASAYRGLAEHFDGLPEQENERAWAMLREVRRIACGLNVAALEQVILDQPPPPTLNDLMVKQERESGCKRRRMADPDPTAVELVWSSDEE